MRRAHFLLVVVGLAGPAFGQTLSPLDWNNSVGTEAAVFLRPVSGQSADAFALARLVGDALETSRELNRVDIPGENVMQLAAPVALVRKASPTSVTVSYEIRPVRGHDQSFSTTCAAGDLDRCVRNIILHTERMARLDPSRR